MTDIAALIRDAARLMRATGESSGWHEKAERLEAEAAEVESAEPVAYRYEFADPISGGRVWRHSAASWNGQTPRSSEPLYRHPPTERAVPEGMMLFPKAAWKFLTGAGTLDGVWFGEEHSSHLPFWWRTYIRKMLSAAPGAGGGE